LRVILQEERNNRVTRVISSELVRRKFDLGVVFHKDSEATAETSLKLRGDRTLLRGLHRALVRQESMTPQERFEEKQMQSKSDQTSPLMRAEASC
jgi:hypothetical protein